MWQLVTQACALHVQPGSIPGLCLAEERLSTFAKHSHTTPSGQKGGNWLARRERRLACLGTAFYFRIGARVCLVVRIFPGTVLE